MVIKAQCLVCDKTLQSASPSGKFESPADPPDDAVVFYSPGNWGSTVFDGGVFHGHRLEIYVCDECLLKHKEQVILIKTRNEKVYDVFKNWDGECPW